MNFIHSKVSDSIYCFIILFALSMRYTSMRHIDELTIKKIIAIIPGIISIIQNSTALPTTSTTPVYHIRELLDQQQSFRSHFVSTKWHCFNDLWPI